jgi:hypothetical protein
MSQKSREGERIQKSVKDEMILFADMRSTFHQSSLHLTFFPYKFTINLIHFLQVEPFNTIMNLLYRGKLRHVNSYLTFSIVSNCTV